jgi:hypothetical protein
MLIHRLGKLHHAEHECQTDERKSRKQTLMAAAQERSLIVVVNYFVDYIQYAAPIIIVLSLKVRNEDTCSLYLYDMMSFLVSSHKKLKLQYGIQHPAWPASKTTLTSYTHVTFQGECEFYVTHHDWIFWIIAMMGARNQIRSHHRHEHIHRCATTRQFTLDLPLSRDLLKVLILTCLLVGNC